MSFTKNWTAAPDAPTAVSGVEYAALMQVSADKTISLTGAKLTRLGKSMVSLLDTYDERASILRFIERIDKSDINLIVVGKFKQMPESRIEIIDGFAAYKKATTINTANFGFSTHFGNNR